MPSDSRPSPSSNRASRTAAFCGSLFGLGLALPIARRIQGAARPDQTPGFARAHGFAAHADLERFLVFVFLSIAGAWLFRAACDFFGHGARPFARRFADPAPWFGLIAAPAVGVLGQGVLGILASSALAFVAIAILAPAIRSADPGRAVVLPAVSAQTLVAWAFLASPLGRLPVPLLPMLIGLFTLFVLIAAIASPETLSKNVELFSGSALLLPIALWRGRPQGAEIAAALFTVASPFALSALRRFAGVGKILKLALPAMLAASFVILAASCCLRTPPVANLFEDGHGLLPASEYLAGRLPYRDIVPGHGLISDGLLQLAELRLFGADYRGISRGDRLVGAFFWPLIFSMGMAASGKTEVGFWGAALSFLLFPQYLFFRVMASFGVLAAASIARRRRTTGAWIATGALIPLALLSAVEFAFYGAVAALAAVAVSEGRRLKNLGSLAAGATAMSAAVGLAFAALGMAKPFCQVTFVFLPALAPAYALGFPPLPDSLARLASPDSLAALGDPGAFYFWCLLLALVTLSVMAARPAALTERDRALVPFLAWFLIATLSVFERQHVGYPLFVAPVAIVLGARCIAAGPASRFRRASAALLLAWAVVTWHPAGMLIAVAGGLSNRSLPPEYVFPSSPKRVQGAAFRNDEAKVVAAVGDFIRSRLGPGETWLDFTSTSSLYFYFDRRCPIRYYEVADYETPTEEREVVRAVEQNPRVRAVLVHLATGGEAIDGISNRDRAPLVWNYIETNFHPVLGSREAVFWERNSPRPLCYDF